MKILPRFVLALLLLTFSLGTVASADEARGTTERKAETIDAGEARLDGRVTAVTGQNEWLLEATSFTSPRNVTKEFETPKSKSIVAAAGVWVHPRGSSAHLDLANIKLGALVGVIGKDGGSGNALTAREIVLAPEPGTSRTMGSISLPREVSELVTQARNAREAGKAEQAIPLYQDALAAVQRRNLHAGESFVLKELGSTYTELGQEQKASEAYRSAADVSRAANDIWGQAGALNGLGLSLNRLGKTDEAIAALSSADELAASLGAPMRTLILDNLVAVYLKTDKTTPLMAALARLIPLDEATNQAVAVSDGLNLASIAITAKSGDPVPVLAHAMASLANLPDNKAKVNLLSRAATQQWRMNKRDGARATWELAGKLAENLGEAALAKQVRAIAALYEVTEAAAHNENLKPDATHPDAVRAGDTPTQAGN